MCIKVKKNLIFAVLVFFNLKMAFCLLLFADLTDSIEDSMNARISSNMVPQFPGFLEGKIVRTMILFDFHNQFNMNLVKPLEPNGYLRVRTVAKRHMRSSMFTASFILVSCVKLP